jgi:GNAT superfamily N-acetyltransferase
MSHAVVVRLAAESDAEALSRLVASFRDHLAQAEPRDRTIPASVARLLRDCNTDFLLALDSTCEPCGYSQLRFRYSLWVNGVEGQLDDIFVLPVVRRCGIGTALLAASIERAREREASVLGLNTNERNFDALRLYYRAGFRAERRRWDNGRQLWLEIEL